MVLRVTLYLITSFILGCAGDLDDQTKKQDLNEDETVDSNDSLRFTPQVKVEVDKLIPTKAPGISKEELESLQAANPKLLPKSEALISPEVQLNSNEPKNTLEEDDELVAEPAPVVEKLVEFEVSPTANPTPAKNTNELFYPSASSESPSRVSGNRARLHRGMPALNLSYLK